MDTLYISLLGLPQLNWKGQAFDLPRRQVRALFYRLAADIQPTSREELCFLFWPDAPTTNARRNLSHLITHLRSALPAKELVQTNKDYLALDEKLVQTDTAEFDRLIAQGKYLTPARHNPDIDLRLAIETLKKAAQLYRGPFLSGFSLADCQEFETWADRERQAYERQYLETLLNLTGIYQDYKDYETAITYAKTYLDTDNLAENVHCKLIELYAASGDRSSAEQQFELCTAVLESELGISPSPKTWALYQSISASRHPITFLPAHTTPGQPRAKFEIPLIGQEEVLKKLDQLFYLACLGRSKIVLVSGEAGSGKSRLLQHIATQYHAQAAVIYSSCNPGMQATAYHPLAKAFRTYFENYMPGIKVNPVWLAEAARLLPEIYTYYPDLPQPPTVKPEEARRRLYEALYQLASSLANRSRPLLLCLDDLQWADTTTLEWLIHLGDRLTFQGSNHMLVIVTCRSTEIVKVENESRMVSPHLKQLRLALKRLGIIEEITLNGLKENHILEYLRSEPVLSQHITAGIGFQALAARLFQLSSGNPLFLFEIIQSMSDGQLDASADIDDLPVPKNLQEVIYQQLGELTARQHRLLEVSAVLNQPFNFKLIQQVTAWDDIEILNCLEELVLRKLFVVHQNSESGGRYQIHYGLVRKIIYDDLGYDRRRFLHHCCGKVLEQLHCSTQPSAQLGQDVLKSLIWHFEHSGETTKAVSYALQAGESAYHLYAFQDALSLFSRALNLLKHEAIQISQIDAKTKEEHISNYRKQIFALSRRGNAYRAMGEMQAYQNDYEEVARIASMLGDSKVLAQVHLREAKAHRWFCRYAQARECAEKVLKIVQVHLSVSNTQGEAVKPGNLSGIDLLKARALRERGLVARAVGDFTNAQSTLEQALEEFRQLNNISYEIHTLCNLSRLHGYLGEFRRAEQLAASALSRCDQADKPYLRRIALGDLGVALAGLGQSEQARECLLASLEVARQIADQSQEIFCLCHLGVLENQQGRPQQALRHLSDGLALAERLDSRAEQSRLYSGIAESHRQLSNPRLAKAFAYKALDLARRHNREHDQELAQWLIVAIE